MWTVFQLNNGRPNPDNYGFGWQVESANGHRIIEHGGSWNGFGTYLSRYANGGLTVAVLENREGSYRAGRIAHAVAGLLDPDLIPTKPR
jgi:CubicO group peptidase (beta-lactamase class C family)